MGQVPGACSKQAMSALRWTCACQIMSWMQVTRQQGAHRTAGAAASMASMHQSGSSLSCQT